MRVALAVALQLARVGPNVEVEASAIMKSLQPAAGSNPKFKAQGSFQRWLLRRKR